MTPDEFQNLAQKKEIPEIIPFKLVEYFGIRNRHEEKKLIIHKDSYEILAPAQGFFMPCGSKVISHIQRLVGSSITRLKEFRGFSIRI